MADQTQHPTDQKPADGTESKFKLHYSDGNVYEVDQNQLWAMLQGGGQLLSVTISVKETRWPVRSEGHEKFISGTRSYEDVWGLIRSVRDPAMIPAARRLANLTIQKDIFETEAWFAQMVMMMLAKDGVIPTWRNPENPFVKAGWDIQQAFRMSGMTVEGAQGA